MGFVDRAATYAERLFPTWATRRTLAQTQLCRAKAALGMAQNMSAMAAGFGPGGAYTGASTKRNLINWGTSSGDADADLLPELPILRDRSQDLYRNSAAARGVIKRKTAGAIGSGLTMRSAIDYKLIGLSPEAAHEWKESAEREFRLWAESRECDFARRLAFNEIQQLAFTSQKVRGDCFIIMSWIPRKGVPYDLRLQLIEADRVSNPYGVPDNETIAAGIERDAAGIPVAIHVQNHHPGSRFVSANREWKRVPIFGEKTGRRQVLHLMEFERVDQSRGEPSLAPVIETLKQLTKFSEAELSAAIVNALLTVFIKRPAEGESMTTGSITEYSAEDKALWRKRVLEMGCGTWIDGLPGEELQVVSANRPSAQFDPFFSACIKQIGMGTGVPYEVLALVFQSSYSASRAALLEFAKEMKIVRAWLRNNLCQAVYEEFLVEAISKGRLHAPGFLEDSFIRAAYCRAEWMGPSVGQIDPVKEVTASIMKVVAGFSTMGRETAELTGADFEQTTETRAGEFELLKRCNLLLESMFTMAGQKALLDDDEDKERDAA